MSVDRCKPTFYLQETVRDIQPTVSYDMNPQIGQPLVTPPTIDQGQEL